VEERVMVCADEDLSDYYSNRKSYQIWIDLIVADWEDVKKHKDLMARLFLPQYILEGYVFDRMWFANTEDVTAAIYTYRKGETELMISVSIMEEDDVFRGCGVLNKEEGIKIIDSLKVID
jgi:hypothetical protein